MQKFGPGAKMKKKSFTKVNLEVANIVGYHFT